MADHSANLAWQSAEVVYLREQSRRLGPVIIEYNRLTGRVTDNRPARELLEGAIRVCFEFGTLASAHGESASALADVLAAKGRIVARANELDLVDLLPPSWVSDPNAWPITVHSVVDCSCSGCRRSHLVDEDRAWLKEHDYEVTIADQWCASALDVSDPGPSCGPGSRSWG